jgi:transcriptional regulator with XRE-family HTH domain
VNLTYIENFYSMISFGTIMRNFRLEKKLSQAAVAIGIGIEQSTYSRIESDILEPKAKTLLNLAIFYEVEVTKFYPPPLRINFHKHEHNISNFSP